MWEPGAQGKITHWNQVRAGWPDAESSSTAPAPIPERSITSPRRSSGRPSRAAAISRPARTTTCSFRASRTTRRARLCSVRLLRRIRQVEGRRDRRRQRAGGAAPARDGEGRHLQPVLPPAVHLYQGEAPAISGNQAVRRILHDEGPGLVKEVKYVPLPDQAYKTSLERFRRSKSEPRSAASRRSGSASRKSSSGSRYPSVRLQTNDRPFGSASVWLEKRRTSFETPAARAPQDDVLLDRHQDLRHPEERPKGASRRTHNADAIQTEAPPSLFIGHPRENGAPGAAGRMLVALDARFRRIDDTGRLLQPVHFASPRGPARRPPPSMGDQCRYTSAAPRYSSAPRAAKSANVPSRPFVLARPHRC